MDHSIQKPQSAPQCQLTQKGTRHTFETLLKSTKSLSQPDIDALEDDLRFYEQTGLIGVQMSRLLNILSERTQSAAA